MHTRTQAYTHARALTHMHARTHAALPPHTHLVRTRDEVNLVELRELLAHAGAKQVACAARAEPPAVYVLGVGPQLQRTCFVGGRQGEQLQSTRFMDVRQKGELCCEWSPAPQLFVPSGART